jgi:hypothetical protein
MDIVVMRLFQLSSTKCACRLYRDLIVYLSNLKILASGWRHLEPSECVESESYKSSLCSRELLSGCYDS